MRVFLVFAALAAPAARAQAPAVKPPASPEAAAAARENMLAKTGGILQAPLEGARVVVVNAQKRCPAAEIVGVAAEMTKATHLPVAAEDRKAGGIADLDAFAAEALKREGVAAVIICHEGKGRAPLLVAPERRWAAVDVSALKTAGASDEVLLERVRKELWRALGYMMGAANSNFEGCLLRPVFSADGLDALKARSLCPEPFNKLLMQAAALGIKPIRTTTYRKACEEGWAPAPTNGFQKAIWDEVKAKKAE